jgi:hypothetical protein
LTAGTIGVSEYIESTGYDPGVYGWRIEGNGDAFFNNVDVRGTIYAYAGLIGGALIDADGVESDNYVVNTSGWRLDNDTGIIYANDIVLPDGIATHRDQADVAGDLYFVAPGETDWYSGVQTLTTITTTGDPVTVCGTITITADMRDTDVAHFEMSASILIDGVASPGFGGAVATASARPYGGGAGRYCVVTLPLLGRGTLTAGSHDLDYTANIVGLFDSSGNAVTLGAGTHSVVIDVSMVVTENHI